MTERGTTVRTTDTIHTLTVPDAGRGRVDRIVADLTGLSRSYVQKLIAGGGLVAEADASPLRSNDIVEAGTRLRLVEPPPVPLDLTPQKIDVPAVYEDDD